MSDEELKLWPIEALDVCLHELASADDDQIESNWFEVYGEDGHGHEGVATAKITEIAQQALAHLAQHKERIAGLEKELVKSEKDRASLTVKMLNKNDYIDELLSQIETIKG